MLILKNFVEIYLPIVAGLAALIKWVYEYTKNLKWEQNKYLIEIYHRFLDRDTTRQIHQILDYNSGIPFKNGNFISDSIVEKAMVTHNIRGNFDDIEYDIRNVFDEYFDNLNELIMLGKCKLIDLKNLRFLLNYYLNLLKDNPNKSKSYTDTIQSYLKFYKYDSVLDFINNKI